MDMCKLFIQKQDFPAMVISTFQNIQVFLWKGVLTAERHYQFGFLSPPDNRIPPFSDETFFLFFWSYDEILLVLKKDFLTHPIYMDRPRGHYDRDLVSQTIKY